MSRGQEWLEKISRELSLHASDLTELASSAGWHTPLGRVLAAEQRRLLRSSRRLYLLSRGEGPNPEADDPTHAPQSASRDFPEVAYPQEGCCL